MDVSTYTFISIYINKTQTFSDLIGKVVSAVPPQPPSYQGHHYDNCTTKKAKGMCAFDQNIFVFLKGFGFKQNIKRVVQVP